MSKVVLKPNGTLFTLATKCMQHKNVPAKADIKSAKCTAHFLAIQGPTPTLLSGKHNYEFFIYGFVV